MELSIKQSFIAMFYFLDKFFFTIKDYEDKDYVGDLCDLVSQMDPFLFADGNPADGAMWEDWINCLNNISDFVDENTKIFEDIALRGMISLANIYIKDYKFKLQPLVNELIGMYEGKENILTYKDWNDCILKALEL